MGKKRVFEIAKELGYQNRDLIEKLQKLGFEVKSHSSTVDEEDVRRALKKAEEERRAKTQESRVSRGVIRRRPIDEVGGAPAGASAPSAPAPTASAEARPASATVVRRRAVAEPAHTEAVEAKKPAAPVVEHEVEQPRVVRRARPERVERHEDEIHAAPKHEQRVAAVEPEEPETIEAPEPELIHEAEPEAVRAEEPEPVVEAVAEEAPP